MYNLYFSFLSFLFKVYSSTLKISWFKIILLVLLTLSCKSKMIKAQEFYSTWKNKSIPITEERLNNLSPIEQTVYNLYERLLDSIDSGKNRLLPNIKYLVIDQSVDVIICDSIIKTKDTYGRLFFKPINSKKPNEYNLYPRSKHSDITLLYHNEEYKKIINKRRQFSTESVYGLKNEKNILAIFNGVAYYPNGKIKYKDLLFKIKSITISKGLKSAIIHATNDFRSKQIYYEYDRKKDFWTTQVFDEWSEN